MTADWRSALAALATPPGVPGSGRLRYGAAMTLWREGLIGAAALEAYRIAAPLDAQDPAALLAEAGAAAPGTEIAALRAAARAAVAACAGPGIAEVLAGLDAARTAGPDPRPHPVVAAHLAAALAAVEGADPPLAAAIRAAAPWLGWTVYDRYPPEEIGPAFAAGHAFAPLALGEDFEAGLFLIAPGVFYRDHDHPAPELYLPLTGPHLWRFAPGAPLEARPARDPVWNPPRRPHAMKAGRLPLLCLYAWTADIDQPARVLPAPDWADLEAAP